jgi:hypothetical protein
MVAREFVSDTLFPGRRGGGVLNLWTVGETREPGDSNCARLGPSLWHFSWFCGVGPALPCAPGKS